MFNYSCDAGNLPEYVVTGCQVLDGYLEAFNTGDAVKLAAVLHFPHVRIAGDKILVWNTPEEFVRANDMTPLVTKLNWGYNKWDWKHLIQFGPNKMHFAVQLSRYTVNDAFISSFESLYIITRLNSRWAVQGRSSYAGMFAVNTGY
jgi:hypothetical protein